MDRPRLSRPRVTRRTLSIAAATGGALAGAAMGWRQRGSEDEPENAQLPRLPGGRRLPVVSADGTTLNAEVFGARGAHTVVLAHGWTEQIAFWGPVIGELVQRGLRVVAYDLRGHGRSAPGADGDYALERFGEDLAAVLDGAVPGDERATVVGHSLGAMSIAAWAGAYDAGARADAAALINAGLGDLVSGHLLFGALARGLTHPRLGRVALGTRVPLVPVSTPISQAIIRYTAFGPTASADDVARYERMLMQCPAGVRAACGVALSDVDLWSAVSRLTIPTLVIAADRDRLTPPEHARRIAAALPEPAGLIVLQETGHMSPLERPAELADALYGLIASAATRPDAATV